MGLGIYIWIQKKAKYFSEPQKPRLAGFLKYQKSTHYLFFTSSSKVKRVVVT